MIKSRKDVSMGNAHKSQEAMVKCRIWCEEFLPHSELHNAELDTYQE